MEVDAEQLSPNSLRTQLTAYQTTVKFLHEQNEHATQNCLDVLKLSSPKKTLKLVGLRNIEDTAKRS